MIIYHYQTFIGMINMRTTLELLLKSIKHLQEKHFNNELEMDEVKIFLNRAERDVEESINLYERN